MSIWYLAFCVECNGGIRNLIAGDASVLPMPFDSQAGRTDWVDAHMDGTNHAVLMMNQRTLSTKATQLHNDNNDASDDSDDRESTVHQTE